MSTTQKIPWQRIAVEGVAIVASILLAFAIDAWWGDRQRAEAEQIVLQNLLDDLHLKQQVLTDMSRFNKAIIESIEALLRQAAGIEPRLSEDAIDSRIADTWWVHNDALWDSAPLNLLTAGGDLALISNPQLVQELAALQVAISRMKNHYKSDNEFHKDVMTPFMIANANMAQISAAILHRPGESEMQFVFPDVGLAGSYRHSELLSTVAFQNILVAKMERLTDIRDVGHPGVARHLPVVIQVLEAELGN